MDVTFRRKHKRLVVRPEVVAIEPNRSVAWVRRGLGLTVRQRFTFEPDGTGTRVTSVATLSGPLVFVARLVMPPAGLRAILVQWLEALRIEAER